MSPKIFKIIFGLLFSLVCRLSISATPEEVFLLVSPNIVIVDVFDVSGTRTALGSGVIIEKGNVITNCHVLKSGKTFQVRQDKKTFKAILQYADLERDLCQLNVSNLDASGVALGSVSNVKVGQRVYAIGAPEGLELTISEGLISSLRGKDTVPLIQTTAAISHGSSGGGLFDDEGHLIGITALIFSEGQNLNFAYPIDWIKDLPERSTSNLLKISNESKNEFSWQNESISLSEKKDWDGLLIFSKKWIEGQPTNADAWNSLGVAYESLGEYNNSLKAYLRALEIQPEHSNSLINIGNVFVHFGKYEQAIECYKKVLLEQYNNAPLWVNLGVAYYLNGQQDLAVAVYSILKKLDPVRAQGLLTYFESRK